VLARRLLSSFQSSLSEITIIAMPESGPGGAPTKDVKIRSYVDPAKGGLLFVFVSFDRVFSMLL